IDKQRSLAKPRIERSKVAGNGAFAVGWSGGNNPDESHRTRRIAHGDGAGRFAQASGKRGSRPLLRFQEASKAATSEMDDRQFAHRLKAELIADLAAVAQAPVSQLPGDGKAEAQHQACYDTEGKRQHLARMALVQRTGCCTDHASIGNQVWLLVDRAGEGLEQAFIHLSVSVGGNFQFLKCRSTLLLAFGNAEIVPSAELLRVLGRLVHLRTYFLDARLQPPQSFAGCGGANFKLFAHES